MDETLKTQATQLLAQAHIDAPIMHLTPISKGGNNRLFKLQTPTQTFALKQYFRTPHDQRDRLASEVAFLRYAQTAAPTWVPAIYANDASTGLALYEFIEGSSITTPTEPMLLAARDFFKATICPFRGTTTRNTEGKIACACR